MHTRKSFVDLSTTQRNKFLAAVIAIKNKVANPSAPVAQQVSVYDQFVALHLAVMDLFVSGIGTVNYGHRNDLFLPWHRQYILEFERELRNVDSSVTLPYWDWTKRSETRNVLFQNDFLGLIGDGSFLHLAGASFTQDAPVPLPSWWPAGAAGFPIHPVLNAPQWNNLPSSINQSLIRRGSNTNQLPTTTQINGLVNNASSYAQFRVGLEHGTGFNIPTHDSGHNWVGGHMGLGTSPNDPVFFMHHCNVDRLWAEWQARSTANLNDFPPTPALGIARDKEMWPWVGSAGGFTVSNSSVAALIRDHSSDPTRTPEDVLDISDSSLDYRYG